MVNPRMEKPWKKHKTMKTIQKHDKPKNRENIVNDGSVQIIASVAVVTFVQETSVSHRFEKETIAITSKNLTIVQV